MCMGNQLSSTMFYLCGGGCACLHPFNKRDTDEVVNQDVDTDNNHDADDSSDEESNV